jgi:hypothetical protein
LRRFKMFSRHQTVTISVVLALFTGLLSACRAEPAPQVGEISVQPSTTILTGETASLSLTASGANLTFEWTVSRGTVTSAAGPSAIYAAPDSPGSDTVTVEVTGRGGSTYRSITFEVLSPPTETPTSTPTPVPTETFTPTPTPTPELTPTPTITPTPVPPLVEVFPQVGEGDEFVFMNEGGELDTRVVESEACRHSGRLGMRLEYAMSGEGNGGWGIHWVKPAEYFDASRFSEFVFWVKGTSGGETFQIGLKDASGKEVKVESETLLIVSSSEWRQVRVPLSKFTDVNTASVENVNLGFNRDHGSGTICIDDIAFE